MSDDIIQRAEQALAGITPGPWYARTYMARPGVVYTTIDQDGASKTFEIGGNLSHGDAKFIAAAPELVRALIDELTRLRTWAQVARGYFPPLDDDDDVSEEAKS